MKTPRDIANARLALQGLLRPLAAAAPDVVRALGAVQAQDFDGAKWALAQRLSGKPLDRDIERDFAEGRIIRTHVLRPTWHFVPPEDLRWMLALTGPRVKQSMAFYNRFNELTPEVLRRSRNAVTNALAGGNHLTRAELGVALERGGLTNVTGQRLAGFMMDAELDAVICSGPRRGKQFTYALVDERVPSTPPRDRDDALGELTRRYFRLRGPATARDYAWWSGLTLADAKRGIEIIGKELERLTIGEQPHWRSVERTPSRKRAASAHLLPNYDEYFIGFKDRSAGAQRLGSAALVTGGSALIAHIVVIDGQVVGGWRRTFEKDHAVVSLQLLARLTPPEKALVARAADRFGRFLARPVRLVSNRARKYH